MTEPRWHEIATEGLPPDGTDVLIVYEYTEHEWPRFVCIAQYDAQRERWEDDELRTFLNVTHWMSIPELPTMPTTIVAKRETDFATTPAPAAFSITDLRRYSMPVNGVAVVEDSLTVRPVPESFRSGTSLTIERNGWRYLGVPFSIEGDTATVFLSRAGWKQKLEEEPR